MTNSLNTPIEVLESTYPVRVRSYGLRRRTGGDGHYRGGDGIEREVEMLVDAAVNVVSDRRKLSPYGLQGGEPGSRGRNVLLAADGTVRELPGKFEVMLRSGDAIRIESPGGGGWGAAEHAKTPARERR